MTEKFDTYFEQIMKENYEALAQALHTEIKPIFKKIRQLYQNRPEKSWVQPQQLKDYYMQISDAIQEYERILSEKKAGRDPRSRVENQILAYNGYIKKIKEHITPYLK